MSEALAVASPCTKVCTIDPGSGWCRGCLRTLDEIAAWGALTPRERAAVWAELGARRERMRDRGHAAPAATPLGGAVASEVAP